MGTRETIHPTFSVSLMQGKGEKTSAAEEDSTESSVLGFVRTVEE